MDLTDAQWRLIEPLIPVPPRRADGRGRPRCNPREVMNGILWVMRTGAAWADIPSRYPSSSTCHRYFQAWVKAGVFVQILNVLAEDLYARGQIDLAECFIDGTFVPAKKGALPSARPSAAKGARSWQLQTALAFLSPFTYRVLRRMNPSLLSPRLMPVLWRMNPNV
jgi:transposase